MRIVTVMGVAALALSAAALAQVARTPVEQKNAPANAAMPTNGAAAGNGRTETSDGGAADMPGNQAAPDTKTEPAAPRR